MLAEILLALYLIDDTLKGEIREQTSENSECQREESRQPEKSLRQEPQA
jgi:hypothetical protein